MESTTLDTQECQGVRRNNGGVVASDETTFNPNEMEITDCQLIDNVYNHHGNSAKHGGSFEEVASKSEPSSPRIPHLSIVDFAGKDVIRNSLPFISPPVSLSSSGVTSPIHYGSFGKVSTRFYYAGLYSNTKNVKEGPMSTGNSDYTIEESSSMLANTNEDLYTSEMDSLINPDISCTSIYTEYDDYLGDTDDPAQLYECKPYYIPTNIRISASLCGLISQLTVDELEAQAPKLPLLFSSRPRNSKHIWASIYQEAREVLRGTQVSSQLPPFHLLFPCLFPEPLSKPQSMELWIYIIILLHYSITYEAWFSVLSADSEGSLECDTPVDDSFTGIRNLTNVEKFFEWLHNDDKHVSALGRIEEPSISGLQLKHKVGNAIQCAPVPISKTSGSGPLWLQDTQFQSCQQQLFGKSKSRTKMPPSDERHYQDGTSPCFVNNQVDSPNIPCLDTDLINAPQGSYANTGSNIKASFNHSREFRHSTIVEHDDKSTDLYFRVFFSGVFGVKYLKPISRGDLKLLEEKYFRSIVVDGSMLLLVLKARGALTLGFSFLLTYKLQRLALYFRWENEILLPNVEILLSSQSPAIDLDFPVLNVIKQIKQISSNKVSLNDNSADSDTPCDDIMLAVEDLSTFPITSDTSLPARVFNSGLSRTMVDVLECGICDVLSKLTDLDLLANRPISLISNISKQGRSKTDYTVLRSVCQTVAIPKLICSTDLFILEKNVLPIVQNTDTDPTLVQHLIRLIETLRAPLNFETSSSPKTTQYYYIGETINLPSIPGCYLICQYLCKGHWRISITPPSQTLSISPRSFGFYDYIYIKPDFTSVINNPLLSLLSKDYSKEQDWHRIMIIPKVRSAMLHCAATPQAIAAVIRTLSGIQRHRSILKYVLIENLFDPILHTVESPIVGPGESNQSKLRKEKSSGLRMINVKSKRYIAPDNNKSEFNRAPSYAEQSNTLSSTHNTQALPLPLHPVSPQRVLSPCVIDTDIPDVIKGSSKLQLPENDTLATAYCTGKKKSSHATNSDKENAPTVVSVISRIIPSWKVSTAWSNPPTIASQETEVISIITTLKKNDIRPVITFDLMLPLSTSTITDLPERYAECMRKCDRVVKAGLTNLRVSLPQSTISYYSCLKKTHATMPSTGSSSSISSSSQNTTANLSPKIVPPSIYDCTTPTQLSGTQAVGGSSTDRITRLLLDYSNNKTWSLLLDELFMIHYKYGFTGVVLRGIDYPYFFSQTLLPSIKVYLLRKLAIDIWSRVPNLVLFAFASNAGHACTLMKAGIIPIMRDYDKCDLNELDKFTIQGIQEPVNLTAEAIKHSIASAGSHSINTMIPHDQFNTIHKASPRDGRLSPFLKEPFSFHSICGMFLHKPLSLFTIDDIHMKSGIDVHRAIESMHRSNNIISFCKAIHNTMAAPDPAYTKELSKQQKPTLYTQMEYPAILDLLGQITMTEFVQHVCVNDVNQTCCSGLCYGVYKDSSSTVTIVISNVGTTRQFLISLPNICTLLECDSMSFVQLAYKYPGSVRTSVAYNTVYDEPILNFNKHQPVDKSVKRTGSKSFIKNSSTLVSGDALDKEDLVHSQTTHNASHIDLSSMTMSDFRKSSYLNGSYDYSMAKFQKIAMLSAHWNSVILLAGAVAHGGIVVTAPSCSIFAIKISMVQDSALRFIRPTKSADLCPDSETFVHGLLNTFMTSTVFADKQISPSGTHSLRSQSTQRYRYSTQDLELYICNMCCRLTDIILCMSDADPIQKSQAVINVIAHSQFSVLLLAASHRLIYSESKDDPIAPHSSSKQTLRRGNRSLLLMKSPLGQEIVEAKSQTSNQSDIRKSIDVMELMRIVPRYVLELLAGALETDAHTIWNVPMHALVSAARSVLSFLYPHVKKTARYSENRDSSGLLLKDVHIPDVIIIASRLSNFVAAKALLLAESGYSVSLYAPLYETPQGQESVPSHILGNISYTGETYRNEYLWHNFGIHYMRRRMSMGTTLEVTLLHSFEFFYDSLHDNNIALNEKEKCLSEIVINEETNRVYSFYECDEHIIYSNGDDDQSADSIANNSSNRSSGLVALLDGNEGQQFAERSLLRAKVLSDFIKHKYKLYENQTGVSPRMIISTPGIGANAALSLAIAFGSQQVRSLKLTDGAAEHSAWDIDESCGVTSEYTFVSRPKMVLLVTPNTRSLLEYMYDFLGVKFFDYGKIFDLIKQLGIPDTGILDSFHPYIFYNLRAAVLDFDVICGDCDSINLLKKAPWISWALSNKEIIVSDDETALLINYIQLLTDLIEKQ